MSGSITVAMVDASLQLVDEDYSEANALADLLDEHGAWDWCEDSEHDPYERLAVLHSSGAYWAIYRGAEADDAERFETRSLAMRRYDEWLENHRESVDERSAS